MELINSPSWHHMTLEQGHYKALRKPSKEQMYASCYFMIYLLSSRGVLVLCPTENVSMSSEIIRVRHLNIKILCQPINIYECVKFPTVPFHNFHALQVERCLTLETDKISLPAHFSLGRAKLIQNYTHLPVKLPVFSFSCWNQPEWDFSTFNRPCRIEKRKHFSTGSSTYNQFQKTPTN